MAHVLEVAATITDRGQTTVPASIRKVLALGRRDRVVFRASADGTVVIEKEQPRPDQDDPVLAAFLAFLARDMGAAPAHIQPVPRSVVTRGRSLVEGVDVDLDVPLPDEDA